MTPPMPPFCFGIASSRHRFEHRSRGCGFLCQAIWTATLSHTAPYGIGCPPSPSRSVGHRCVTGVELLPRRWAHRCDRRVIRSRLCVRRSCETSGLARVLGIVAARALLHTSLTAPSSRGADSCARAPPHRLASAPLRRVDRLRCCSCFCVDPCVPIPALLIEAVYAAADAIQASRVGSVVCPLWGR